MSFRGPSSPELIIEHTGQVFPLSDEVVTIGRDEDNSLVLADPEVSAHHARVFWDPRGSAYYIEDLGSVEGTYVNERSILGPVKLHHGDVIRVGNTVMGLSWQTAYLPPAEVEEGKSRAPLLIGIVAAALALVTLLCLAIFAILLLDRNGGEPDVTIQSPTANSRIAAGQEVVLQATASGARDITLLELSVDGILVSTASSSTAEGTSLLTASKSWSFDVPGEHRISAEAYTAGGKVSEPASIQVAVVAGEQEVPTATATATASPTPTEEATATQTATPEPTASATPPPPPRIEYFQASPSSIYAGDCTTLQWGQVDNAAEIVIEPGVGAVEISGARSVCPNETTTYVLTARGPGGSNSASAEVTVLPRLADLIVESIAFDPDPAKQGGETEVSIAVRNVGLGAAAAFDWEWQAGPEGTMDGSLPGLGPGERTVIRLAWTPAGAYESLVTAARVDVGGDVDESDEENNQFEVSVEVTAAPSEPQTVVLISRDALDGYVLNDGSVSTNQDILIGNGKIEDSVGEIVARGFLSFNLSELPAEATIQAVELRFYQAQIEGDPYGKLGNLVLQRVDYGSTLDAGAFEAPALDAAAIAQQTSADAWYVLSDPTLVTWLQRDREAGRSRFQLRLRFSQEPDGDGEEDWVSVTSGDDFLGDQTSPQLIVTFVPGG